MKAEEITKDMEKVNNDIITIIPNLRALREKIIAEFPGFAQEQCNQRCEDALRWKVNPAALDKLNIAVLKSQLNFLKEQMPKHVKTHLTAPVKWPHEDKGIKESSTRAEWEKTLEQGALPTIDEKFLIILGMIDYRLVSCGLLEFVPYLSKVDESLKTIIKHSLGWLGVNITELRKAYIEELGKLIDLYNILEKLEYDFLKVQARDILGLS